MLRSRRKGGIVRLQIPLGVIQVGSNDSLIGESGGNGHAFSPHGIFVFLGQERKEARLTSE